MSSSQETILVTGANGYVAGHVLEHLLREGRNVRGTVRSKKAAAKLRETFSSHLGSRLNLAIVEDLTNVDSFRGVIDSATTGVIHMASPGPHDVEDIAKDMLLPAISGATGVLEAVAKFANMTKFKRVLYLSSLAAMLDVSKGKRIGYIYTEEDWNPITFDDAAKLQDTTQAYLASKALAERAVWKWMQEQEPTFDLVCVNPSLVLGPHVEQINTLSEIRSTVRLLWNLVDAPSIPTLDFAGVTDVRNVAKQMVALFDLDEASGRRFLLAQDFDWQSAADFAREWLPELRDRITEGEPGTGKEKAEREIYMVDGSKTIALTGVDYISLDQTIKATLTQCLEVEQRDRDSRMRI